MTKKSASAETRDVAPSRRGKKAVTVYFEPEIVRQLKLIGLETDRSMQAMLSEAVTQYLKQHRKRGAES